MRPRLISAELLSDARAMLGEGPVWDERSSRLLWLDIPEGVIHRLDPRTGATHATHVGQQVGAVAPCADGGLIAAVRDGFGLFAPGSDVMEPIAQVEKELSLNRKNDGKCDCRGRFWAGTMAIDHAPRAGKLYCLTRANGKYRVSEALDSITVANGLDWSLDNRLMYYIDSATQRIDVFDFDAESGSISNRRVFAAIAAADGLPDGMTVDAEGHVWVALFRGGIVRRYTPKGEVDMEVAVPVTLVTSCAFGGSKLEDLYITTARHRLTPAQAAEQATAGGVFVCRPGARGRLPFVFK